MAVQLHAVVGVAESFGKLRFTRYESQSSVEDAMSSCPSTPSTPSSPQDYEIQTIKTEDREELVQFFRKFFFRDEPLNCDLQIVTDQKPVCADLEDFCIKDYDNGVSLKAVQNGKIIGVCANVILEKGYIHTDEVPSCTDEKFDKIVKLLDRVAKESDVFSKFPDCDKAMNVKILSVDDAFRGRGIAKELVAKSRELARGKGCGFMSVECTSHFTACAVKRLGFELLYTLNYADHKNNNEVVFKPEEPHRAVTVYTQRII